MYSLAARLRAVATPKQKAMKQIEGYQILRETDIPELKIPEDFRQVNLGYI